VSNNPVSPWGRNPNVSTAHEGPHYKERQQTFVPLGPETLACRDSALKRRSQRQVPNTDTEILNIYYIQLNITASLKS